jgi:hypothetical protein
MCFFRFLPAKKSALRKIFGSNLFLRNQELSGTAHPLYAALRAARENPANLPLSQLIVPLYSLARTFFMQNPGA